MKAFVFKSECEDRGFRIATAYINVWLTGCFYMSLEQAQIFGFVIQAPRCDKADILTRLCVSLKCKQIHSKLLKICKIEKMLERFAISTMFGCLPCFVIMYHLLRSKDSNIRI